MIRSHLAQANRYIAEMRADIARERVIIEHALDSGYPSAVAESMLHARRGAAHIREASRTDPRSVEPTVRVKENRRELAFSSRGTYVPAVSRAYLSRKLDRPLPTKDGGALRTVLDARTYMLALSKDRERRTQWQRAAELLLAEADVGALSKAVELALFYDAKLDVAVS